MTSKSLVVDLWSQAEDDEAVNKMFEWVRMRVGFYGSTPSYWPVLKPTVGRILGTSSMTCRKKVNGRR